MTDQGDTIGILWMGGQSSRFKDSNNLSTLKTMDNKIYASLFNQPLFLWALIALKSNVSRCILSFHTPLQYNQFLSFIKHSSQTS